MYTRSQISDHASCDQSIKRLQPNKYSMIFIWEVVYRNGQPASSFWSSLTNLAHARQDMYCYYEMFISLSWHAAYHDGVNMIWMCELVLEINLEVGCRWHKSQYQHKCKELQRNHTPAVRQLHWYLGQTWSKFCQFDWILLGHRLKGVEAKLKFCISFRQHVGVHCNLDQIYWKVK